MDCRACTAELDHCHGMLIEHVAGSAECTEPGCANLDPVRHREIVTCADLSGGCACSAAEVDGAADADIVVDVRSSQLVGAAELVA
jgi:hypothetical protein